MKEDWEKFKLINTNDNTKRNNTNQNKESVVINHVGERRKSSNKYMSEKNIEGKTT